jgi:hypothetical protein
MMKPGAVVHDIHSLASKYLSDLERGNAKFYAKPDEDDEALILADSLVDRVVIMREEVPHYLAGIKPSGRPVWTHDLRIAMSYNSGSAKLDNVLERFKLYDMPVMTMPACWFSNHQERREE